MGEIFIYGDLGGEVSAHDVVAQLSDAEAEGAPARLRINSFGGDAFEGLAIYSAIIKAATKIPVTASVEGIAASAASLVAIAAPHTEIMPGAFMMIHHPWSLSIGDAGTHRQTAAFLEKLGNRVSMLYADRMQIPVAAVDRMLANETWFDDFESVASGLATKRIS